jgi:hypothetical protein
MTWKWLLAIVVVLLLTGAGVWLYQQYGLALPPLTVRQAAAIAIAVIIIAGKMALKGLLGKEFKLNEQGQETSLMALGVALPTAADYFLTEHAHPWHWFAFSFVTIIVTIVTALCSKAAEEASAGGKTYALWSTASMALGAGAFLFYMFLLVLKTA